jgi:hypothetical protein
MNEQKLPRRTHITSTALPWTATTNSTNQNYCYFNAAATSVTTSALLSVELSNNYNQLANESPLPPSTLYVPTKPTKLPP